MVTRKSFALQYNLMSPIDVGMVECGHQQMQVRRRRLHHCYLGLLSADHRGDEFGSSHLRSPMWEAEILQEA